MGFVFLLLVAISDEELFSQNADSSRPHLPRRGANLIGNSAVRDASNWTILGDTTFDSCDLPMFVASSSQLVIIWTLIPVF
ncbi:hypothetical protein Pla22_50070 [Rubripirellula amarantea]|uniref:Uncharacterized protein n=1 Tax=Rubripirellula amarantea TaxID=2527999 RepID=A0A5C5WBX7_9BACT|nr:hypothetical protein [Rubripirellula amarantea]TWT48007.1 hypothetical protein Pla22_50070 [Rubripirellula amarantea]